MNQVFTHLLFRFLLVLGSCDEGTHQEHSEDIQDYKRQLGFLEKELKEKEQQEEVKLIAKARQAIRKKAKKKKKPTI